jgi:AcrR family transcriptional regulator
MPHATPDRILDAAERLFAAAASIDDVSMRGIARAAGANVSSVTYHFGSRDKLVAAVMRRVYQRFSTEKLNQLQRAIDARAPDPPDLAAVISALIEPSVRWSFDPESSYPIFVHFSVLIQKTRDQEIRQAFASQSAYLKHFVKALRRIAPWLSEGEIGWRIHCALGVRSSALRDRARGKLLVGSAFDFSNPDEVLRQTIAVIAPMFAPPVRPPGRLRAPERERSHR